MSAVDPGVTGRRPCAALLIVVPIRGPAPRNQHGAFTYAGLQAASVCLFILWDLFDGEHVVAAEQHFIPSLK
jgi:hypothetical protein